MTEQNQQWQKSREVVTRVYVTGRLVLDTPAHFGNGDAEGVTDINLLRDPLDGRRPLLPGASIAGALRNYVREYELGYGYGEKGDGESIAERVFGYVDEEGAATNESWLMVDDALGTFPDTLPVEIRDGVAINAKTRTALVDERGKGSKYDVELLAAGTAFRLHFELWLREDESKLLDWLAIALRGLELGHIRLGLRKRRGFGQCHVSGWQVRQFDMRDKHAMLGWLAYCVPEEPGDAEAYEPEIARQLGASLDAIHAGEAFRLNGTFQLQHSLLIRSDVGDGDAADMVHLRNAAGQPVLSGTSLAGALRARAYRIANTLKGEVVARALIDDMFGRRISSSRDKPSGSRVIVDETVVQNSILDRVHSRVKIDRFTGGAYPQALFSQQPLFARTETPTRANIRLALRKTEQSPHFDAEVGLLLLVLKDLWTGDLPLGGESSVGRGRLRGEQATLAIGEKTWTITAENGRLRFDGDDINELEQTYLAALHDLEEAPT